MPLQQRTYLGCFSENTTHRVMNNKQSLPNEVNITESCIESCSDKNFKYAGVSSLTCYCGDQFYDKLPADTCECNVEHTSHYKSQYGGLNGQTSVYKLDYVDTCYQDIGNFLISRNRAELIGLHQNCESIYNTSILPFFFLNLVLIIFNFNKLHRKSLRFDNA